MSPADTDGGFVERRRSPSGNHRQRIDDLIERTNDPTQKATLMVLSSIDAALANVPTAEAFEMHVRKQEGILTGIKYAWFAGSILGLALLGMGGYILTIYVNTLQAAVADLSAYKVRTQEELAAIKNDVILIRTRQVFNESNIQANTQLLQNLWQGKR